MKPDACTPMFTECRRRRLITAISIVCVVPPGLATKVYDGPGSDWMRASLGGVFYEVFWCLLVFLCVPRLPPVRIATSVFLITCMLEFLQLWHPPLLEAVRASMLGRALIGDVFDCGDFPYYVIGSAAGWTWLAVIRRSCITEQARRDDPARS